MAAAECIHKLLLAPEHHNGMNSILKLPINRDDEEVVTRFTTLSSLFSSNFINSIDLIKIDVEGYEVEVLKGLEPVMKLFTDTKFVLEISPTYLKYGNYHQDEIYDFFRNFGYAWRIGPFSDQRQYNELFEKTSLKTNHNY